MICEDWIAQGPLQLLLFYCFLDLPRVFSVLWHFLCLIPQSSRLRAPLTPLEIPHEQRRGQRRSAHRNHRDHPLAETWRVGCGVEDKRPPGVDHVVPHAGDTGHGLCGFDRDSIDMLASEMAGEMRKWDVLHRCEDDGTFLVVIGTYLVRPATKNDKSV